MLSPKGTHARGGRWGESGARGTHATSRASGPAPRLWGHYVSSAGCGVERKPCSGRFLTPRFVLSRGAWLSRSAFSLN
jgi:hypothetical protein